MSRDIESDVIDPDANADIASLGAQSHSGAVVDRRYSSIHNVVIIDDDDDEDDDDEDEVDTSNGDDDADLDLISRLSVLDQIDAQENTSSEEDRGSRDAVTLGIDYAKLLRLRRKNTKIARKKAATEFAPAAPKMSTRYRFRDLLLGDFSFNDDGER